MNRTMKRTWIAALALALAALGTGCTHTTLAAPKGFARMDGSYDFRATNPKGVVVAARTHGNDPQASLGFWAEAVDLKLESKGYKRIADKDVKSTGGVPGKLLQYDMGSGYRYWVAVFASDRHVVVTEATGYKDDVEPIAADLEHSMASVQID